VIIKPQKPTPAEIKAYRAENLCSLQEAHRYTMRDWRKKWLAAIREEIDYVRRNPSDGDLFETMAHIVDYLEEISP
jgi:hypothetical protein